MADAASRRIAIAGAGMVESLELGAGEGEVHVGRDADGALVGVAVPASGMGYQDQIRVLYGYDPSAERIIGLVVLESRETPGLGDRIETDERFRASFADLDVRLDASGSALRHALELVKSGERRERWQVDGISGATVSSRAVTELVDRSAASALPAIRSKLDGLAPPGGDG